MQLHVSTIQAITVLPFALMAAFLAWTWWVQRSSAALVWWSLAFAFAAASALMTYLDAGRHGRAAIILDDVLFVAAHIGLLLGFRAFWGAALPLATTTAAFIAYAAFLVAADLPTPEYIRIALVVAIALTLVMTLDVMRYSAWSMVRVWRGVVLAILAVHLAVLSLRLSVAPVQPGQPTLSGDHLLVAFLLLAPIAIPIALGYTMLGMVLERRNAALRSQALRDPLTGALNRRGLDEWLGFERQRAVRDPHERPMAAVAVDVDHFKAINDTFGHAVGDRVLCALVDTLEGVVRPHDALARFGGEEFVILMPGIANGADATAAAERMRSAVSQLRVPVNGSTWPVTASFGVALTNTPPAPADLDGLVDRADRALYAAKRAGRNRVRTEGDAVEAVAGLERPAPRQAIPR